MYLLMCFCVCSFLQLTPGDRIGKKSSMDTLTDYLMKYGYLSQSNIETGMVSSTVEISNAVKNLQKMAGLDVNGDPEDPELMKFIEKPRCGVSDRVLNDPNKPQNFEVTGFGWTNNLVTWKVHKFSEDLEVGVQREIFQNIFYQWSQHTDISFYEVNNRSNADIMIFFLRENDEVENNMDGPDGTIAYAFMPADNRWDVHFDEDEKWVTNETALSSAANPADTSLLACALHEIGHSLGLDHSSVLDSVMYANYDNNKYKLHEDDIEGIQDIYGSVVNPPNPCITGVDDVILIQEEIIVFKSRWFWRFDKDGNSKNDRKALNIWEFWTDLPLNQMIHAATELPKLNLTLFFIGRRFWLMRDKKKVESFPVDGKDITQLGINSNYVDKIDAAMVWGYNQRVYIFSGYMYWRLSNDTRHMNMNGQNLTVDENYPMSVENWLGNRMIVDAAFTSRQGDTFVFRKNYVWKFIQMNIRWVNREEITQLFHCEANDARSSIKNSGVSVMQTCRQLLAMWSVVLFSVVPTLFQ